MAYLSFGETLPEQNRKIGKNTHGWLNEPSMTIGAFRMLSEFNDQLCQMLGLFFVFNVVLYCHIS